MRDSRSQSPEKKKDQSLSCAQLMYGDENVNAAAILKVITF